MMNEALYRAMNASIVPEEPLIRAVLSPGAKRPRHVPRRFAALAAAAALCAALVVPAAARTDGGYALLYAVAPAAAQFFQPVRMSCTDSGVTMEVLSVRVGGHTAQAYIALSGETVDATADLFDSYSLHVPSDQISHCEKAGWDEEARTALFLVTTETMDGSPLPAGGKMTFSFRQLLTGKEVLKDLTVDLALGNYAAAAETAPIRDADGSTADAYSCTGGGYQDPLGKTSLDTASMLLPVEPLAVPAEGLPITGAGYADGLFHIQVCRGNAVKFDNHCQLWLVSSDGSRLEAVYSANFAGGLDTGTRTDYTEFAFDAAPWDLQSYTLHGDFYTASTLTEGNWKVTFPLEST